MGAFLAFQAGNREIDRGYSRDKKNVEASSSAIAAGIVTFVVALLAVRGLLYYGQPSFQGTWFGYFPSSCSPWCRRSSSACSSGGRTTKRGWLITVGFAVVFFGVAGVHKVYSTWGPGNAQRYAALASIRAPLPKRRFRRPTPTRWCRWTRNIAAFKGQTALTSTSQNLGSRFRIDPDSYVLQAVQGHRYWITPLIFSNSADSFRGPLFGNYCLQPRLRRGGRAEPGQGCLGEARLQR